MPQREQIKQNNQFFCNLPHLYMFTHVHLIPCTEVITQWVLEEKKDLHFCHYFIQLFPRLTWRSRKNQGC